MTADTGYEIDKLTVDGVVVTSLNPYCFNNVKANHTINVTWKKKKYTITT